MPINLTPNAIAMVTGGDLNMKPLVQVLGISLAKHAGSGPERYRLLLSDSVCTQQAMLGTQLNDRVRNGSVKNGSVIQMLEYTCNQIHNRKIIVILNMETIIPDCEIIENPNMLSADMAAQEEISNGSSLRPLGIGYNNNMRNFQPPMRAANQGYSMQGFQPSFGSQNYGSGMQNFLSNSSAQLRGSSVQGFQPTVQPSYRPPPSYRNHGAIMKNEAPARIIPIAALNPYQGRWAIKARVTSKGDLRRYNNARGDGKVFSFDLLDSDGGEIRVTCFNAVVDRFFDVIEVGRVYLISKGSLKPAQKNFNHLKNEWEIFLETTSTVDLCTDEDNFIPRVQFSFKSIGEIENVENNTILDVIGIVISVNPSVPILRKNGMETQRRILNLKDGSAKSVELTLWGDICNKEGQQLQDIVDTGVFPVLAVKAGKVNDFSGKSLGTISSSQLIINPDIPEAHSLRIWFDRGGQNTASVCISRDILSGGPKNEIRKTVSQTKLEGLGRSDKPDWVTISARITFVKTDTFCYTACPLVIGDRQCNKKVTSSGSRWLCDRCNQEFDECDYRYLLQVQIQDHTGLTWVTAFQESGEEIMGLPAKRLYQLKYELQDDTEFASIVRRRLFQHLLFRLKIKEETYGKEQRVKITVVNVGKVDYSSECRYMLDSISTCRRY